MAYIKFSQFSQVATLDPVSGFVVGYDAVLNQNVRINALDLANALNAVPYTGADADVNLGEYQLIAGQVSFDLTPTGTAGVGVLRWNDSDGTLDLGLKGGNVTLQIGQENVIRVVNKSGADLLEANFQVVRVRNVSEGGAAGQRLAVVLAQGDTEIDSATTIGLVTETILNNQEGFITVFGNVNKINTTGAKSFGGLETWVDGDMLYVDPDHAGYLTNVKPIAPDHMVVVGYVLYAHGVNGKIFVKVDNGYELNELHNVLISSPTSGQALVWNGTVWVNGQAGIYGTGTVNYIPKFTSADILGNSLIFDNGTSVGIGTASPNASYLLDINGGLRNTGAVRLALSSGNVLIGTNTDVGYKLVVNGTIGNTGGMDVNFNQGNFLFNVRTPLTPWGLVVDPATSNVGIGNRNPVAKLQVDATGVDYAGVYVQVKAGQVACQMNAVSGSVFTLFSGASAKIVGMDAAGDYIWINSASFSGQPIAKLNWTNGDFSSIGSGHFGADASGLPLIASAVLAASSTSKGFLPPRMTAAQLAAISAPATGLLVYQTDGTEGLYEKTSAGWRIIASAALSPGGADGSVQYKSGTSFGGATYVGISSDGNILLSDVASIPTAPAANKLILFSENHAGRMLPAAIGPTGTDYNLQAALYGCSTYMWLPGTGTTVAINWGTAFTARNSGTGAAQATPTKASTSGMTSMNRATFGTGSTTTGASGIQSSSTVAWRGNAANLGGFLFFSRFGLEALSGTYRAFVGLSENNAAMAANPSTWNNTIGLGFDDTDATWQVIMRNTTTTSKVNTAISITLNQILDLYVYAAPNAASVRFFIKNAETGAALYDSGDLTSNILANTVFMYMQAHIQSATGATPKLLSLNRMYLETDL